MGPDLLQAVSYLSTCCFPGVSLKLLDGKDVGIVSDIPCEAHGKILKTKYYKSRRSARFGVRGDGFQSVLEEDNLYMAATSFNLTKKMTQDAD